MLLGSCAESVEKIKKIIESNKEAHLFTYLLKDNVENSWLDLMYNNEYVLNLNIQFLSDFQWNTLAFSSYIIVFMGKIGSI